MHPGLASGSTAAIPLHAVTSRDARAWLAKDKKRRILSESGFTGASHQLMALPDAKGAIRAWALGLGDGRDAFALALAGLPQDRIPGASGLFNFARITAGSFGTSIVTTLWDRRATLHHAQLAERTLASGAK